MGGFAHQYQPFHYLGEIYLKRLLPLVFGCRKGRSGGDRRRLRIRTDPKYRKFSILRGRLDRRHNPIRLRGIRNRDFRELAERGGHHGHELMMVIREFWNGV